MEDITVGQFLFVFVSTITLYYAGYWHGRIKGMISTLQDQDLMMKQTIRNIEHNVSNSVEIKFIRNGEGYNVFNVDTNEFLVYGTDMADVTKKLIDKDGSKFYWARKENLED